MCAAFVKVLAGHLWQDLEPVPLTVLPEHCVHLPGLLLAVPAGHLLHFPLTLMEPAEQAADARHGPHSGGAKSLQGNVSYGRSLAQTEISRRMSHATSWEIIAGGVILYTTQVDGPPGPAVSDAHC